jgi:hypothetical protein
MLEKSGRSSWTCSALMVIGSTSSTLSPAVSHMSAEECMAKHQVVRKRRVQCNFITGLRAQQSASSKSLKRRDDLALHERVGVKVKQVGLELSPAANRRRTVQKLPA